MQKINQNGFRIRIERTNERPVEDDEKNAEYLQKHSG